VIATVSDRKIQSTVGLGTCVKEYNFTNGVPTLAEMNWYHMVLSAVGGTLQCTQQNTSFLSAVNPSFGSVTPGSYVFEFDWNPGSLTASDGLYLLPYDFDGTTIYTGSNFWTTGTVMPAGHYSYTYTPSHAGSIYETRLAFNSSPGTHSFTIDNLKMCPLSGGSAVTSYSPDILSHTDYYPGGQTMPGRSYNPTDYRYSHNGQEQENEIYTGAQSAECWMYDSRILRRWEIDPITYPWQSPYAAFNNNPIYFSDPLGLEGEPLDGRGKTEKLKGQPKPKSPEQAFIDWYKNEATIEEKGRIHDGMKMESIDMKSIPTSGVSTEPDIVPPAFEPVVATFDMDAAPSSTPKNTDLYASSYNNTMNYISPSMPTLPGRLDFFQWPSSEIKFSRDITYIPGLNVFMNSSGGIGAKATVDGKYGSYSSSSIFNGNKSNSQQLDLYKSVGLPGLGFGASRTVIPYRYIVKDKSFFRLTPDGAVSSPIRVVDGVAIIGEVSGGIFTGYHFTKYENTQYSDGTSSGYIKTVDSTSLNGNFGRSVGGVKAGTSVNLLSK
jgi:hypothetical protein